MIIRKILKLIKDSEELEEYKKIARKQKLLLKKIADKCGENAGKMYYENSAIGFREIQKLAESDINKVYKLENNPFLVEDIEDNIINLDF